MSKTSYTEPQEEQAASSSQEGSDEESEVDFIFDAEPEKDAVEKELEHLVFGDAAGFRSGLADFNILQDAGYGATSDTAIATLADADLFVNDLTGEDVPNIAGLEVSKQPDYEELERRAAWYDSDDERMEISIATVPRLRKLRRTADEDIIDGKEYTRRLRQQYEMLHPRPEWAIAASEGRASKRRRLSQPDEDEDGSQDEMDIDEDGDLPSVAPLSSLLRDASSLVRTDKHIVAGKRRKLRPETISIQRTKDIAGIQPSAITSLSFHPTYPLLLTSGPSSTLYLHRIASSPPAPEPNPLLISMHIKGAPLATTAFHPTDSRIFMAARRKFFHMWNLDSGHVEKVTQVIGQKEEQRTMDQFKLSPDGQYMALLGSAKKGGGIVNILSTSTMQWQSQVRVEGRHGVTDFAWWRNSKGLCILAKSGEITEWSVQEQKVVHRWQDEGAVGSTVLALGGQHEVGKSVIGNDRWIATGSSSGIVNVYDRRIWLDTKPLSAKPKPTKVLDHLTTPISHITFSYDGQVMAMASKWKRDALRLVHLPSVNVFKNWPTSSTPLGRITGLALADGGIIGTDIHSLLAVANEQGKIRLWEIS